MSREYPTPVRFELVVPDVRQFCNSNGLNYGAINFAFIAFPAVAVRITVKPFAILCYCTYLQCMRFFPTYFGEGKKLSFGKRISKEISVNEI